MKKDMSPMRSRNVQVLLELTELISALHPPGPDHLLESENPLSHSDKREAVEGHNSTDPEEGRFYQIIYPNG